MAACTSTSLVKQLTNTKGQAETQNMQLNQNKNKSTTNKFEEAQQQLTFDFKLNLPKTKAQCVAKTEIGDTSDTKRLLSEGN